MNNKVINRVIKGGAGFLCANILGKGFALFFIFLASKILGANNFGLLALSISIIGVIQNLAAFGLPISTQRFLSGKKEKGMNKIYGTIISLNIFFTLISSVIIYLTSPWISINLFSRSDLTIPLRILAIGNLFAIPFFLSRSILQAKEKVSWIVITDFMHQALKIFLLIGFLTIIQSVISAAWAIVASSFCALSISVMFLRRLDIKPNFSTFKNNLKKILGYSSPLVITGFSYFLAQEADRLMLGVLSEVSSVGIYTVASNLAIALTFLHRSFVSIFMPIASEAYRKESLNEIKNIYLFISRWSGLASGIALIIFTGFGRFALNLFGFEYNTIDSYHVLIILTALYFIGTWVGPTGALLQMSDGHKIELVNVIVFLIINIILNVFLIPKYGIVGAASATFISVVLLNLMQVIEITYRNKFIPFQRQHIEILILVIIGVYFLLRTDFSQDIKQLASVVISLTLCFYGLLKISAEEKAILLEYAKKLKNF